MDSEATTPVKLSPKPLASLGRDEMNLAEFPISLLTDRVPKDQNVAVYQDEIHDEKTGLTLTRKLTITAGNHGLTTAADDDVILSLIQLTREKNNFTQRRVEFSRHELVQRLGWTVGGASYDRLLLSLKRWTSVFLQYENAWRDNRTKTWTTAGFHIIDKYEITDTRSSNGQLELLPSYIVWGEDLFESFQAGYLKPLDYDLCMGLRNSTAKRMYRFLDKRFYRDSDLTFELKLFAHEHIGLGHHYEGPAHLKRNLFPAIQELEKIGFLEPLSKADRFRKIGSEWKIRLLRKATNPALPSRTPPGELTPAPHPLLAELINCGVTETSAVGLLQHHAAEKIQAKLEEFTWLAERKDRRIAKNPAGFLVKSITTGENGYKTPPGFISQAERERQALATAQAEQAVAEAARRRQESERRERQLTEQVKAYQKSRTPAQLAQLEADAIAQASEETRQNLDDPAMKPFKKTLLSGLVREHIARLLEVEATQPELA